MRCTLTDAQVLREDHAASTAGCAQNATEVWRRG